MQTKTKEVFISHPADFIEMLVETDKQFGTYSTPDGDMVLCFKKIKDTVYEDEAGVAVLIKTDEIKHLLNVIRLARQRARKAQYENETRFIED